MKTARVALIALCMVLLVLPSLAIPFFPLRSVDGQGQYLADFPALTDSDSALNSDFDKQFEAWLCDHFAFRDQALRANALLNYRLLRTSPNERVIVGKGDWLYLSDTVPDYTGEGRLSDVELGTLSENLRALSTALSRRGAKLYVAIIPNKSTVYPQFMPGRYVMRQDGGNIEQLKALCEALPATWIDLVEPLKRAAENDTLIYYQTDTHWNDLGAAIAAQAVLEAMNRPAEDYSLGEAVDFAAGDLARLMGAGGALSERVPKPLPTHSLPEGDYSAHRVEVDGPGEGSLLVYRDSFGTAIGPWLAQAYGNTELRWEYPLDASRPCDDALLLLCERNLREYLLEPPIQGEDVTTEEDMESDDEDDEFLSDDRDPDDEGFVEIDEDDDFFTDDEDPGEDEIVAGRGD